MIIVTADVGGTKTTAAVTDDGKRLNLVRAPGAAVRPGRALASATTIADAIRSALAQASLLRADAIVVGAAGAGRDADAEEVRIALARERLAPRTIVVSDVALAFEAMALEVGVVLVAGTGSVAYGRAADGSLVRRGGFGWQMGDEGAGYWIGRRALQAIGLAEDGRGPATALSAAVPKAVGAPTFRDIVGWSTVATPREVATLSHAIVKTAADGDAVAQGILEEAVQALAALIGDMASDFPSPSSPIPVGLAGGLLGPTGPLGPRVRALIKAPFAALEVPVDPLAGGLKLAARGSTTGT